MGQGRFVGLSCISLDPEHEMMMVGPSSVPEQVVIVQ